MKNIHVLPTENESRLRYNSFNKVYELCEFPKYHTDIKSTHNIYITSDEEIKEGDYFIAYSVTIDKKPYISCASEYKERKKEKGKIILTTDQDLIKDGVQVIDDEFLEWFVKNPNCEEIEVKFIKDGWCLKEAKEVSFYKTIIPKEEPKQETLEEAVQKVANSDDFINGTLFGSQWQQERMYNKEEVRKVSLDFFYYWWNSKGTNTEQGFDEWFEQFKNK